MRRQDHPCGRIAGPTLSALALVGCFTLAAGADPALPRHAVLGAAMEDAPEGAVISRVLEGGAAERAGLAAGDFVVSIGGHRTATSADVVDTVRREPAGSPVSFEILRKGEHLAPIVTLGRAPDEQDPAVVTDYGAISFDGSFRRTLVTYPHAAKDKRPAILILGGIGCFSVDVPRDAQDPYLRIAHDLGRRGFVVMRLEKSGIGDSAGPPCMSVDFFTEERSYGAALEALKRNSHVARGRIYLLGHSIGTVMAPRIAGRELVAGVIIAEGVGRNWFEYELANLRRQLELDGEAPDKVDATLAEKEVCMHRLLVEKEVEAAIEKDMPACRTHNLYPAPSSYLQQVASLNLAESWTKLSVPVLALYGTSDFVTAEADQRRIIDIVNRHAAGRGNLVLIDGMDHHLDAAGPLQQAYDMRVKQKGTAPYDERFSNAVADWLCKRESCNPPV
jgi:alpha-beta hydrolase superfamily lysophospholipase